MWAKQRSRVCAFANRKVEGRQESSFEGGGQLSRQDGGSIIVEKSARQRRREHLRCPKEYQP